MKQELVSAALNNIRAKRRNAESEYQKIMAPLFEDEEYKNLSTLLQRASIQHARLLAYNSPDETSPSNSLSELEQEIATLRKQIDALKKKYNVQNVQISYSCPHCKDTGYIDGNMCTCLKAEISKILLSGSGFEKLEDFNSSIKTCGNLTAHYELMKKWCASDFKKNLVLLSGATGVGKTHLVRCMANELISQGKVVKIATAYAMNQDFREFSKKQKDDGVQKYIEPEVLFIDDFGTEPMYKNVTQEFFYLVINERKMRRLPTVITTNLDLMDIRERYDERICSRIADRETSINLLLTGDDKRLKKNN